MSRWSQDFDATRLGRCHVHKRVERPLQPPGSTCTQSTSSLTNMSSSEDENFDLDISGSESDGYAPPSKKTTKAAPKKAAPKAAPKPKPAKAPAKATKKKVLVDKDDNASDGGIDFDDDDDDDRVPSARAAPAKKKTASETYQKVCKRGPYEHAYRSL